MLKKIGSFISQYFRLFFILAVVVGLVFPDFAAHASPHLGLIMMVVMFLSALKIDMTEMKVLVKKPRAIICRVLVSMVLTPIVAFYLLQWYSIDWAVGAFILAAAPAGIATATLNTIVKGNVSFAVATTVISSLICPFTMSFLADKVIGTSVSIDARSIFQSLLIRVVVPVILAILTKRYTKIETRVRPRISPLVILLFLPAIWGPLGENYDYYMAMPGTKIVMIILLVFSLSLLFHIIGWFGVGKSSLENKITGSLGIGFMNMTLAVVIASTYFGPEVLLFVLLYEFPRDLMLIPFMWFIKKKRLTVEK